MRFVVQSKKATFINVLVILFSLSFYIFLFVLVLYRLESGTLFPSDILLDIKGDPDQFLEPKPFLTILEQMHINLFIYNTAIVIISSILYRTALNKGLKYILVVSGFISMYVEELSTFGVLYFGNVFAYIGSLSFFVMVVVMFLINTVNLIWFIAGKIK